MNISTLSGFALLVALIAWICLRQFLWSPVRPQRSMKIGMILGIIAVANLVHSPIPAKGGDLGILAIELVAGAACGLWQAKLAEVRPISDKTIARLEARARRKEEPLTDLPEQESRAGVQGLIIWLVLLGLRLGLGIFGSVHGYDLMSSMWPTYLVIAANRIANGAVSARRTVDNRVTA
ncbi:hypothetical protein AB0Y14_10145 [Rothia sp. HC945]|uniref:hypothetical protein n=1 Tax=Rothia sp. HC945 TaxID=3171170 RepID=UPI002655B4D7|nr:hypothetical protein [Kocuria sp.]